MNIYDAIDTWATAITASTTVRDYCKTNFLKGLLVQVDEDSENPISSDDAPYCMLFAYTGGDDSPVSDNMIQQARIIIGTVATGNPHTPTVTTTRSATANGLRKFGAGNLCVDLLDLVLTVVKAQNVGNCVLTASATYDVDGVLMFPLQVAGTTIQIQEVNDMSTF